MDNSIQSDTHARPKRILLCLSGSVSAYKMADVLSMLRTQGHQVRCLLTAGAEHFVSPVVLESLSGHPVRRDLFPETGALENGQIEHIQLARWPDLILFAPASANLIARLAHGLCDDLVTTVALATRAPTLLAPAMNTAMWEHPATQANLRVLAERGMEIIPPTSGRLACGEEGAGKLPSPAELIEHLMRRLGGAKVAPVHRQKILITAGPTISRLDAVRYLTNPSTGKMGAALAEAALEAGCEVFYVLGTDKGVVRPVVRPEHTSRFHLQTVETAEEMAQASLDWLPHVSGVIATAAVLDYRVATPTVGKKKRSEIEEKWTLLPSTDVLKTLREAASPSTWFCGFAAETDDVEAHGKLKLEKKKLDFLFSNAVARAGETALGFGTDSNSGTLHLREEASGIRFPEQSKTSLARGLIAELLQRTAPSPARQPNPTKVSHGVSSPDPQVPL